VVTERIQGSTLRETLSTGERLPNPRIASVLQDVGEVLEWARAHGIVHRGVTFDSLYFDRETHAPQLVLALTPIPLEGLPDSRSDARTIGRLAWAMFTGHDEPDPAKESLGELRADLARRVIDETTAMATGQTSGDSTDVERFVSVIAMADVLRQGEIEIAQLQAELIEERRVERVRLEAEARASEDRAEAMEERVQKERSEFAEQVAREEARVASEAAQVTAERAQFEQERQDFAKRAAALAGQAGIPARADAKPVITPVEEELLRGQRRLSWMIPVSTIGLLVLLVFVGAMMARRGVVPHLCAARRAGGAVQGAEHVEQRGGVRRWL